MARRRRGAEPAHENAERWLLTYADMITLLMVLFVVMYAISNTDLRKFTALAQSFSEAFNKGVLQGAALTTISSDPGASTSLALFDTSPGIVASEFRAVQASLRDYSISQGLAGDVSVDQVPEGIAIRISEALLFQPGRASVDGHSEGLLRKVEAISAPLPNALRIEGHTDDLPPTGPFYADNWTLSTARALAVLNVLRSLGIAPDRLSAAGYAGYRPVVPNLDDASRARNRRVDVLILFNKPAIASPGPGGSEPFGVGGMP